MARFGEGLHRESCCLGNTAKAERPGRRDIFDRRCGHYFHIQNGEASQSKHQHNHWARFNLHHFVPSNITQQLRPKVWLVRKWAVCVGRDLHFHDARYPHLLGLLQPVHNKYFWSDDPGECVTNEEEQKALLGLQAVAEQPLSNQPSPLLCGQNLWRPI